MPFCLFQHSMFGLLNACILDYMRVTNQESRYGNEVLPYDLVPEDCCIPSPICEYLRMISNVIKPRGDLMQVNFPEAGIPNTYIPPL